MRDAEGVIKFRLEHTAAPLPAAARAGLPALAVWRQILRELGLVGVATARYGGKGFGNLSARVALLARGRGRHAFVITGTQTGRRRTLRAQDFALVQAYDARNNQVRSLGPAAPSSEAMTHGVLYDLSQAIRFVFHTHAPVIWRHAAALDIPTTDPRAAYGSRAMALEVARLYRTTPLARLGILAMGGHQDGVISFGRTAEQAGLRHLKYLARAYRAELARAAIHMRSATTTVTASAATKRIQPGRAISRPSQARNKKRGQRANRSATS